MQKKQLEVSPFLQKNSTLLKIALAAAEGIKLDKVINAPQVITSPSAARAAAQKNVQQTVQLPKPEPVQKTEPVPEPDHVVHPHAKAPIPQEVYQPKPKVEEPEPKPKPERPTVQVVQGRWF